VGDLEHFLDPDAGVAEHLDAGPRPERLVGFQGEVAPGPAAIGGGGVDHAGSAGAACGGVGSQSGTAQGEAVGGEGVTGWGAGRGGEQRRCLTATGVGGVDQLGQQGCQFADPLVHPRLAVLGHLGHPGHVAGVDRGRRRPRSPPTRLLQSPVAEVGVEGTDGHQDGVPILAFLAEPVVAVADVLESLFPTSGHVIGQVEGVDAGVVEFQVPPEQQHQFRGELADRAVVQTRGSLVQVVDKQVPDRAARDVIPVDQLLDAELPTTARRMDGRGRTHGQDALLTQQRVPMGMESGGVARLGTVGLNAVSQPNVGQKAAVVHQDPTQLDQRGTLVGADDPRVSHAAGGHPGEPLGVADLLVAGVQIPRRRLVQPLVAGPDHISQDQPPSTAGRVSAQCR
jgi:hypothetical protein